MIEIRFVGTGTPVIEHTNVRACASEAIIIGDDILLFDCGRYTTSQLFSSGIPPYNVSHLFFTHSFHFDHTSDYPNLIYSRFHNDKTPLTVYGPPGTKKMTENVFNAFVCAKGPLLLEKVPVIDLEEGQTVTSKHWNLSCVWTNHGPYYGHKSLAYKLFSDDKSVVISGDVGCGRSEVDQSKAYVTNEALINLAKDVDVFIMDADLMHTTVDAIAWAAKASNSKQVVLTHMHLPGWSSSDSSRVAVQGSDKEIIDEIRSVYGGVITIAKDLNSIYL
jgi:ribonuclease BN (tRNA processing enzyme)